MFTHSFWKTVLWFTPWTIHWVVYETQNKPTFTNIGILIRSFSFGWLEHVGTPIISEIHIQPHFLDNWTNFVGDPAGIAPNDLFPIPRTLSEWPVLGKKNNLLNATKVACSEPLLLSWRDLGWLAEADSAPGWTNMIWAVCLQIGSEIPQSW